VTTGDFLVAHSSLPTGTALQHLLALQIGAGTGQTVFASQFAVSMEMPRTEFARKAKRAATPTPEARPRVSRSDDRKALYCLTSTPRMDAAVYTDELWVKLGTQSVVSPVKAVRANYIKKGAT